MANKWSQLSKNNKNLIVATIVFTLMALARYYGSRNTAETTVVKTEVKSDK